MNKLFELISGRVASLSITGGIVIALMSFPSTAQEAEELQVANDEPMEEILVTGVRRSLELALVNKRNADSIMDGIAAESIGKFPDLNLADSLSRITGVQLGEDGPGGERREGQISVRGLPNRFAKVTVNGQTLATYLRVRCRLGGQRYQVTYRQI
jgi:outer membrane receptor for ferrienterochelin and colicin